MDILSLFVCVCLEFLLLTPGVASAGENERTQLIKSRRTKMERKAGVSSVEGKKARPHAGKCLGAEHGSLVVGNVIRRLQENCARNTQMDVKRRKSKLGEQKTKNKNKNPTDPRDVTNEFQFVFST